MEDAIAYTEGPSTISGLLKQRLRWKKGRIDTFIKYRRLFFSRDKKHSKFLTHFLFPITLFYEIALIFEPLLIFTGAYYIYKTADFRGVFFWIGFTVVVQIIIFTFGSKKNSKSAFMLSPLNFMFSYLLTIVEVYAIYGSIKLVMAGQDVKWQNWNRKGILKS